MIIGDEYNKPILNHIENPAKAEEMRDTLKRFYSVIKDCDRYIWFCFITGVGKFNKNRTYSTWISLVPILNFINLKINKIGRKSLIFRAYTQFFNIIHHN
ncbi:AAA family ATPase, partial [Desulfobacter curvatus]|uniref:AAA family ATPase n=1 Tax=Desulfobacter curvatus TaxID=2290 RepID=UPI001FDFC21D